MLFIYIFYLISRNFIEHKVLHCAYVSGNDLNAGEGWTEIKNANFSWIRLQCHSKNYHGIIVVEYNNVNLYFNFV